MKKNLLVFFCCLWLFFDCSCKNLENADEETVFNKTREMNNLIKNILNYFKNPNAKNIPLPIPDPFHRPDHTYPSPLMIKTSNVMIYGISKMKVENLTSDLVGMKIKFDLHMPILIETGNYQCTFLLNCSGVFNLSITNGRWFCGGELKITESGNIAVSKIELDLKHRDDMKIYVRNAGLIGAFLNNFGDVIFESMKSYILLVVNTNAENYMNEQLKKLKIMLPNSLPPFDIFTFEARKLVKNSKYDPFYIPDYQYATNILLVEVTRAMVHGASSFHRTGSIKALVHNHTLQTFVNFGTEKIHGDCEWEFGVLGLYSKLGTARFQVDYVNISLSINQSFDLTKKPKINDMNIRLGNLQLIMDGSGLLDYVLELGVNLITNWLRNQIIKLFHNQITFKVQDLLAEIDLEEVLLNQLSATDDQSFRGSLASTVKLISKYANH